MQDMCFFQSFHYSLNPCASFLSQSQAFESYLSIFTIWNLNQEKAQRIYKTH